jgi:hypothetical protein
VAFLEDFAPNAILVLSFFLDIKKLRKSREIDEFGDFLKDLALLCGT